MGKVEARYMGSYVSPALSYLQDIREPWRRFEITYILGDAARRGAARRGAASHSHVFAPKILEFEGSMKNCLAACRT